MSGRLTQAQASDKLSAAALLTDVPAMAKLRPLRDQVFLEPLEEKRSDTLYVPNVEHALRGRVLAVGPGCYPYCYDGPKETRTKMWQSRKFKPTTVKVGDIVHLGGAERGGYSHFFRFTWGDRTVLVIREEDVAAVEKPAPLKMGYDGTVNYGSDGYYYVHYKAYDISTDQSVLRSLPMRYLCRETAEADKQRFC